MRRPHRAPPPRPRARSTAAAHRARTACGLARWRSNDRRIGSRSSSWTSCCWRRCSEASRVSDLECALTLINPALYPDAQRERSPRSQCSRTEWEGSVAPTAPSRSLQISGTARVAAPNAQRVLRMMWAWPSRWLDTTAPSAEGARAPSRSYRGVERRAVAGASAPPPRLAATVRARRRAPASGVARMARNAGTYAADKTDIFRGFGQRVDVRRVADPHDARPRRARAQLW